jgi:hypothetical protein
MIPSRIGFYVAYFCTAAVTALLLYRLALMLA